ncbi:MAG: hypothetical protein KBS81_09870 [Spirochaetales bacterium]|nr:hypothetical protein [Candidatus Physcosoma equi]
MNRIKKLKLYSKKLEAFEPYETDDQGRRVIRLHVNDSDSFLSPLSIEGVPAISDETAYLLNFYLKNMAVDTDEKLLFMVSGHDFSVDEMAIYKKAIRNYYKEEFIDVQEQFRENTASSIWMIIVGLIILGVQLFIRYYFGVTQAFLEIIDIAGWVFLWEAVDLLFFHRPKLRRKQLQNLRILEAQFVFQEKTFPEDEIPFAIQKLEETEEEEEESSVDFSKQPDLFTAVNIIL